MGKALDPPNPLVHVSNAHHAASNHLRQACSPLEGVCSVCCDSPVYAGQAAVLSDLLGLASTQGC